jgi:polyisoprenoid-binding protein YceI
MNQSTKSIATDELRELLQSGRPVLLMDVLPNSRYQQVHLPGAVNACVFEVTFLTQVAALAKGKSGAIVIYGASGQTLDAVTAADKLLRNGYTDVSVLSDGLAGWQAAGHPVEGDAANLAARPAAQLADGTYPIDTMASRIEWAGRNPNTTHHGTLRLSAGEVQIAGGEVSGAFTLDMQSIENLSLAGDKLQPVLEAHLKSDDFFFVTRFPEARFAMLAKPTADLHPASAPNYQVTGQLRLRGISAEQSFPATIVPTEEGRIAAEAHFDIDRTRWGAIYGSAKFFEHLGMHLVFDQISLQLRVITRSTRKGHNHERQHPA